jgi:MFS family permease
MTVPLEQAGEQVPHSAGAGGRDPAPAGPARIPRTILALGVVSLLNDIGGDAVSPLLPAFVAVVGGGPEALGLIEGVADATASLLQIASGYLADRTGRLKGLTIAGYGIANLLRPLLALATAWWQILVIRFGDRAGKGIRGTPRDALVADAAPAALRGRGYGLHRGLEYIGALLGPAIAYLMLSQGFGLRAVFAWTILPGASALLVLGLFVNDVARRPSVDAPALGLPPSAAYRRFLIAVLVFTLGSSSDAFLLWRAREIGIAVALAPILWMVLQIVKSASSFGGGALSDWWGRREAILAGWGLYAAVYVGFALARTSWQVWLLFALYGIFYGLTESPERALVVDLVPEDWRGRALGTYNAVVGLATLPASVIFGVLYQNLGAAAAFGFGATLAIAATFILPPAATVPAGTM